MVLKILFGQRKESYPGEFAPEALAIMSEYDYDENGSFLHNEYDIRLQEKHWESVKIIDVKISDKKLTQLLRPLDEIQGDIT